MRTLGGLGSLVVKPVLLPRKENCHRFPCLKLGVHSMTWFPQAAQSNASDSAPTGKGTSGICGVLSPFRCLLGGAGLPTDVSKFTFTIFAGQSSSPFRRQDAGGHYLPLEGRMMARASKVSDVTQVDLGLLEYVERG